MSTSSPAGTTAGPLSPRTRRLRVILYATTLALAGLVVAVPVGKAVAKAVDPPTATIAGMVFNDMDGDGVRGSRERGVGGVSVSDGAQIVQTAPDGRYSITTPIDRRNTDLVFITQPAGYSVGKDEFSTPRFYRDLGGLTDGQTATADFALTRDPDSRGGAFSFANVADPHVNAQLPDQMREINSTQADVAFVQVSGDLTNNATDAEFTYYKNSTAVSQLPVWPAVGNHEYASGSSYADRIDNYRRHVGPEWYSFDYSDRHFLVLEDNGAAPFGEQLAWVEKDLALNVGDKHLVVLTHQPMNVPFGSSNVYDRYGELLERYGAELILVGHEHSNDVEPNSAFAGTAKHVQTSSSSYSIDNSPRGFRYVHMAHDDFQNPFRMYGVEQSLTITSPADGSAMPWQKFPGLQVTAYDTSDPAVSAEYRVDGAAGGDRWSKLQPSGDFTWRAELPGRYKAGKHTVEVRATDAAGRRWSETSTFTLTDEEAIVPSAGADWSQHHGDAGHTGIAADSIAAGQRLAWSFLTDGGTFLTGSPVIADGVVYAGTRDENGEGHSAVYAVDLATGEQLWRRPIPSSVHGSVAVSDGRVFAPSLRGSLFALDAATGEQLWQYDPEAAPEGNNQRTYGYYGPTVAVGKVFWPYQTRHGKASQGLLAALDVRTGETVWESPMAGATMSDGTAVVSGDQVFVGSQTADQVIAYDLETGARQWVGAAELGGWQDGIPTAADGRVYIGSNNGVIARDAATGRTLWKYRSPSPSLVSSGSTPTAPAVRGDILYMAFPSGAVTALDSRTGAVIWDRLLPGEAPYRGGIQSSPAISGNTLFVGSNNGSFYALDAETGQPLWEHEIGTWVTAGPAVSGNTVVVGALDGNLYAYTPGGTAAQPWATVTGTVSDPDTGKPVDGAKVTLTQDGQPIASTTTVSDGHYTVAAQPGGYAVEVAKRGYLPGSGEPSTVEVGSTGEHQIDLVLAEVTAPVAGIATSAPDFGGGSTRIDARSSEPYHYVMNDRVQATVVGHTAGNNLPGTFQPGWLADIALTDPTAMETLDWSENILSPTMNKPSVPWNRSGEWLTLPDISADGDTVTATGTAQIDPDLKTSISYRALPDAPVVKMTLTVDNTSTEDFQGYYQYLLDPDSAQDRTYLPGFDGYDSGFKTSGWTSNYLYIGAGAPNGNPAQGIAWDADQPSGVTAFGYIGGVWFDASVPAGQQKTISWYHITDYPGASSPTSEIAWWASQLHVLDDEAPDRSQITGTVTAAAGGAPIPSAPVRITGDGGDLVTTVTTNSEGRFAAALDAGTYTVSVTGLGFATTTREVSVTAGVGATADLALPPVVVEAGTGKRLAGALVEAGTDDIVLENAALAMAVSVGTTDPQLGAATVGKPLDMAVAGRADQLDWINLPYVSTAEPTGGSAWQQRTVRAEKVEVVENTSEQGVVRVTGASTDNPALTVTTTYHIRPGEQWVTASTEVQNTGAAAASVWVGDALDHDGAGSRSGVGGIGSINTPSGSQTAFEPTRPWIGMAGTDPQTFGLVYAAESGEFSAYGSDIWVMSKFHREIAAGESFTLSRKIVAAPQTSGDQWAPLDQIAGG